MIMANIGDSILDLFESAVVFLIELIPGMDSASWLDTSALSGTLQDWASYASPFSGFVPFDVIAGVVVTVFATWSAMLLVQLAMKIYAMIRGGAS